MNEASRLAYLNAMGIDSFVPRLPLPGAKPSIVLRLIPSDPKVAAAELESHTVLEPKTGQTTVEELKQSIAHQSMVASRPIESAMQTPVPGDQSRSALRFSLITVRCAGILWVDNLPLGRGVDREYLRLIVSITRALGRDPGQPEYSVFEWPLVKNRQTNQGEDAAAEAVEEFVARQIREGAIQYLVVLGEQPLSHDSHATKIIYSSVSVWSMLQSNELKRVAWQELKQLRSQ